MVCHCDLQTFRYAVYTIMQIELNAISLVVYLATVPCIRGIRSCAEVYSYNRSSIIYNWTGIFNC